jgi:hypothetical protein
MDDFSFTASALAHLDKYQVPEGPTRETYLRLAQYQEADLEPFDLIVTQRVSLAMRKIIEDVYRPRSPLEAQLEYDRARNDLRDTLGVEPPEWDAANDPEILQRWHRWNQPESGN